MSERPNSTNRTLRNRSRALATPSRTTCGARSPPIASTARVNGADASVTMGVGPAARRITAVSSSGRTHVPNRFPARFWPSVRSATSRGATRSCKVVRWYALNPQRFRSSQSLLLCRSICLQAAPFEIRKQRQLLYPPRPPRRNRRRSKGWLPSSDGNASVSSVPVLATNTAPGARG